MKADDTRLSLRLLLAAGGSGGHLTPAIALADRMQADGDRCWMLSTARAVDGWFKTDGLAWHTVDLMRPTPLWRWMNPIYAMHQARAMRRIEIALKAIQPDVVVTFGGYLGLAVAFLALRVGIPVVIHEQNVLPGRANRWLAPYVHGVALSFKETLAYLPRSARWEVVGNPIRFRPNGSETMRPEACRFFGLDPNRMVMLVMGGSQGAEAINRLVLSMWAQLPQKIRQTFQVIHLAGMRQAHWVEAQYLHLGMDARVFPFLDRIDQALASADLAIGRAGATSIAELAAFGLPAILIPYPYAGRHQWANAQWVRSIGGAVVLAEREATAQRLWEAVKTMIQPETLGAMRRALVGKANVSAADRLAEWIRQIAHRNR
jgi:UDP-N-acetylglucosamine--N-acetylmuramyl-(pentapeptide) pyrophosphoryl-undecaprenol N-acetylglucosamine transferase